jgi:hypothetical protein
MRFTPHRRGHGYTLLRPRKLYNWLDLQG